MNNYKLYLLSFLIMCLISGKAFPNKITELNLGKDAITVVHTSVGYTTLLELSSKPTRVVIGDQDSFRVEFVGNNLAVKPLIRGIKTNLFIFTRDEQFQCTLVSGPSEKAQYLVRLQNKLFERKPLALTQSQKNIDFKLTEYRRYFKGKRHELFFEIANKRTESIDLNPSEFEFQIEKRKIHMASVFIEKTQISPKESARGRVIFFTKESLEADLHFILSLKNEKLIYPFSGRIL